MKYPVFILLFFLSLLAVAQEDTIVYKYHFNQDFDYSQDTLMGKNYHADSLINHAASHIGTKYVPNGKLPGGFDCSGFNFYNFKRFGIYLPYFSYQQAEIGKQIETKDARKGDLIAFKGHDLNAQKAGHVGIVVENKNGRIKFIHASTSHGVKYDFSDGVYFKERLIGVRRIVD